jgi:soluble lytic murein transglycosylase-like protein
MIDLGLWSAIVDYSEKHSLDPYLVAAVIKQESAFDTLAARYESHYRWLYQPNSVKPPNCSYATEVVLQKISFGLMQVMGAVLREWGLRGWLTQAFHPAINLDYGCRYLAYLIQKHEDVEFGLSAYNSGSPTNALDYANKVLSHKPHIVAQIEGGMV